MLRLTDNLFLSNYADGTVKIWDCLTKECVRSITLPSGIKVTALAQLNAQEIILGCSDGSLRNLMLPEMAYDFYNLIKKVKQKKNYTLPASPVFFKRQTESSSHDTKFFSKESKMTSWVPMETKRDGNCAFHAILGAWNKVTKEYLCEEKLVFETRKNMADAICKIKQSNIVLYPLLKSAIEAMVMNQGEGGQEIQKVRTEYNTYLATNESKNNFLWDIFERELKDNEDIINYINEEVSPNGNTLKMQFQICLNNPKSLLAGLILSVPKLNKAFEAYNAACNKEFNFDNVLSNPAVIKEYAYFIGRSTNWLLPVELKMLAYIINMKIDFYTTNSILGGKITHQATFNPEGSGPSVAVRFDGINHYERLVNTQIIDSLSNTIVKNKSFGIGL